MLNKLSKTKLDDSKVVVESSNGDESQGVDGAEVPEGEDSQEIEEGEIDVSKLYYKLGAVLIRKRYLWMEFDF